MIEYKVTGTDVVLRCSGTPEELIMESLALIGSVYQHFKRERPMTAMVYQRLVSDAVADHRSPIWDDNSIKVVQTVTVPSDISKLIRKMKEENHEND